MRFNKRPIINGNDYRKLRKVNDILQESEKHKFHYFNDCIKNSAVIGLYNKEIKKKYDKFWQFRESTLENSGFYSWDNRAQYKRRDRALRRFYKSL